MAVLTSFVHPPLSANPERKRRRAEADRVRHLLPRGHAPTIAELSSRLYSAYAVDGGNVRLAGCALELRPIVHLRGSTRAATGPWNQVELFLGDDGLPLASDVQSETIAAECVDGDRPTRFPVAMVGRLIARARWLLEENCRDAGGELDSDAIGTEVVWRRFAAGKLRFTIGDCFAEIAFADWVDSLQPPPFVCPETGVKTYRIATTDDGRMAAAEEIVACEQSGRRMLRSETVVCSVTRQRIAVDFAEQCPITGEHTRRDRMAVCSICCAKVAPKMMDGSRCDACAAIAPIKKCDPRMCLVLGEHPGLDHWRRWRLAETPQSYVLEGRSLMQRLLVVVDQQSLEVRRLAHRGRFQTGWQDVAMESWKVWL
ncbi:MAG: hypothetical protein IT427_02625 [Pirellulales bacterium]|nr:hypothetical protein [Pirellulales bacterium]